jgi:hypothetical protein
MGGVAGGDEGCEQRDGEEETDGGREHRERVRAEARKDGSHQVKEHGGGAGAEQGAEGGEAAAGAQDQPEDIAALAAEGEADGELLAALGGSSREWSMEFAVARSNARGVRTRATRARGTPTRCV